MLIYIKIQRKSSKTWIFTAFIENGGHLEQLRYAKNILRYKQHFEKSDVEQNFVQFCHWLLKSVTCFSDILYNTLRKPYFIGETAPSIHFGPTEQTDYIWKHVH